MIKNSSYLHRLPFARAQLSGVNSIMAIAISSSFLCWRCLVTALIVLAVVVIEIIEHQSYTLDNFAPDFLHEILIFGMAFPLVVSTILSLLAHPKSKEIPTVNPLANNTNGKVTNSQRVLVVENERLLGAGVENLLTGNIDLDVVGITPGDEAELIKKIEHVRPEVIILDADTYLTAPVRLLILLKNYSNLQVMVVSANNNLMHIYNKQQFLVTEATDLANVIRRSNSLFGGCSLNNK